MPEFSYQYFPENGRKLKKIKENSGNILYNMVYFFHNFFYGQGKLEYKWLSIESMQNRILTTKSDVWSFGILLWEMFSFGDMPYRDIEIYQLKRQIMNGHTMERPPYANDNMCVHQSNVTNQIFEFNSIVSGMK